MQIMPATAADLQVSDPLDPKQNVDAGSRYLKSLLERFGGDLARALGAYNAGPGAVEREGGVPQIDETQELCGGDPQSAEIGACCVAARKRKNINANDSAVSARQSPAAARQAVSRQSSVRRGRPAT